MAKPYGLAFTAAVVGMLIGAAGGSPLIYAAAAFALVIALANQRKIDRLSNQLAELRGDDPQPQPEAPSHPAAVAPRGTTTNWGAAKAAVAEPAGESEADHAAPRSGMNSDNETSSRPSPASGAPPKWLIRVGSLVKAILGWFTSGNIFMRVGIVLLFLGIGFLISYASGLGIISVEMRMTAIALAAVAGLVVGQRLLARRRDYALMLQGAAIGVLYLDIFGAFSLYDLLPATFAFALLFAVSGLAASLAVLQNAAPLAYAGFAGGFLAPILASSGSGNYVGLFSYYVVLNITLLAIAWFKSWRPLNLLGFYFTFGVAALWGLDSYSSDKYASIQPFLIIFFLIYACIPILYARRQPINLKGYVDGSLLFGTSIISFGMQLVLVDHFEYGSAWSALGFGVFYIVVASLLWRRREEERLLVEVFLALGVVFATLVIPFALGASDTAGAWALEGAGLIWIGLRQNRPLARAAGIALQLAAAIFWLSHQPSSAAQMFVNSSYLSGILLATAGFFSARLYRNADSKLEAVCEPLFIIWFVLWWFGIGCREIILFVTDDLIGNWFVGYAVVSAVTITVVCRRWEWPRMQTTALLAVGLYALAGFQHVVDTEGPLHEFGGWLVWPVGMLAYYWILSKSESSLSDKLLSAGHIAIGLLLMCVLYVEILWLGEEWLSLHRTWVFAMVAALNIAALQLIHRANFWPIVDWPNSYVGWIGSLVGLSLALMILASFENPGTAPPLPWLPILNPLDAIALIGVLSLITHWLDLGKLYPLMSRQNNVQIAWVCLGLATFVWLNVTLFRALHHWWDLRYDLDAMLASSIAQTSLTILWVIVGMLVVIVASRREMRNFWLAGGGLLVIVVAKLFLEDLANTGSLERIVSFLGVGAVLILIGYFSPLPPKAAEQK